MGLFDIFSGKKKEKPGASTPPPQDKGVARLGRVAGDRLAQSYDRLEAIQALAKMQSPEAAAALLKRFTFYVEPSMTDQEEKEIAFRGIVDAGEQALEPVLQFCEKAESLNWPLKVLRELLTPEGFVEEVITLLDAHDTDYARNVDPKIQLIAALENERSEDAREAVLAFLEDVSEPVRFQAVLTLFSMGSDAIVEPVVEMAISEESVRIRNKVAEGLAFRGWVVPQPLRDKFAQAIYGGGFALREGKVVS